MDTMKIINNMIRIINVELRRGRETAAQDGIRNAEDWFNEYRYDNELDQNTITNVMRFWYSYLENERII